jgi:hypothetical protein
MRYNYQMLLIAMFADEKSHGNMAQKNFEPKRNFLHRGESILVSSV